MKNNMELIYKLKLLISPLPTKLDEGFTDCKECSFKSKDFNECFLMGDGNASSYFVKIYNIKTNPFCCADIFKIAKEKIRQEFLVLSKQSKNKPKKKGV